MTDHSEDKTSILVQRGIEARILSSVHEVITRRLGADEADRVLSESVSAEAIAQGSRLAQQYTRKPTLNDLHETLALWTEDEALVLDVLESTQDRLSFNVVRCRYAELYKEMGLQQIGHLISCNRDGDFCIGFNPDIKLARSQTIMSGATWCDFRYTYTREVQASAPKIEIP